MIVRWNDVLQAANDVSEQDGRPCGCGEKLPQEYLELYAISDGRLLTVKKVQTHGQMVRIWLDV